jgi:hypothetical protein
MSTPMPLEKTCRHAGQGTTHATPSCDAVALARQPARDAYAVCCLLYTQRMPWALTLRSAKPSRDMSCMYWLVMVKLRGRRQDGDVSA